MYPRTPFRMDKRTPLFRGKYDMVMKTEKSRAHLGCSLLGTLAECGVLFLYLPLVCASLRPPATI